jgi:hypothetical protein
MQVALEEWLLSTGKLVTATDVAKCVRERINPEVKARNDALLSQNRVAPELLMSRLASEADSETPTAGSGLTQAPAKLWRGKPFTPQTTAPPPPSAVEDKDIVDLTPTHARSAAAPAPARGQLPVPRPSDATALVDFVPVGAQAPTQPPARRSPPVMSSPLTTDSGSGTRHLVMTAVVFVAIIMALLVALRLFSR